MEDLLFYVLNELLEIGTLEKCATKVAKEEAMRISVKTIDGSFVTSFCFLRSEIGRMRKAYDERRPYLCDWERERFDKFFAFL